jgi:hypothetical protein
MLCSDVNVRVIIQTLLLKVRLGLAQREDVLDSLEIMRESLEETLKEASMLCDMAIEEEVLIGAENINKTCNNALRYARHIRTLLTDSGSIRGRNR